MVPKDSEQVGAIDAYSGEVVVEKELQTCFVFVLMRGRVRIWRRACVAAFLWFSHELVFLFGYLLDFFFLLLYFDWRRRIRGCCSLRQRRPESFC